MKTLSRIGLALVLLTSSVAGVADPALPMPSIEAHNTLWQEVMNHSLDDAELKALYTENAVVVPPSQEILAEHDFTDFLNKYIRTRMVNLQLQPISLRTEGDKAYQSAVWVATMSHNGQQREIDGELTSVFQRQPDGSWKIEFQTWN